MLKHVCTSSFHTYNHHHSCLVLSVFGDARYAQVSGNKKLIYRVLTKDVWEALADLVRQEMDTWEKPQQQSADEENIFEHYTSLPIPLISEKEFEAKTKDPAKVQQARQIMTAMAKANNLKQEKGNGSFLFNH